MNNTIKEKRKKPQGKLDERIIIGELLKKPKKKDYEIAKMAGSLSVDKDSLSRTLQRKVASSVVIQRELEKHRNATLAKHNKIQDRLFNKLITDNGISDISPERCLDSITKTGNLIHQLTKQDSKPSNTPTAIQINIVNAKPIK